jgi:hypothetical protein
VLHAAFAWHVCTPLPEHCRIPGEHGPVQAPWEQVSLHPTGAPQFPSDPHVCTPVPWHRVDPGAHTPVQMPAEQA